MPVFPYVEPVSLTKPAMMKGEPLSYTDYTETLKGEQRGALNYLDSPDIVWNVPESLKHKVDESGALIPFFGDTTVFNLSQSDNAKVSAAIDGLTSLQDMLATPLDKKQLHLTLHDLSNSSRKEEVAEQLVENEKRCRVIFAKLMNHLANNPEQRKIKMVSTCAYPCLNISVLLGFAPASEQDYNRLINIYNLFEEVIYLDYWLRPHVTLAYFFPRTLNGDEIKKLRDNLQKINESGYEIELDVQELAYQHFSSMNHYQTIFTLKAMSQGQQYDE